MRARGIIVARFSFDSFLCVECHSCEVACKQWHEVPAGQPGFRVITVEESGEFPDTQVKIRTSVAKGCDLCRGEGGFPHCASACPTGALRFE